MMTFKEWISKYGQEDCCGCEFNNPTKASCSYRKGYCIRYDEYKKDQKREKTLSLFSE